VLVKTVIVFLLVMAGIAMLGKALFPGLRPKSARPPVCRDCGRYLTGPGDCGCGGKG
jgi:hypothetical protein